MEDFQSILNIFLSDLQDASKLEVELKATEVETDYYCFFGAALCVSYKRSVLVDRYSEGIAVSEATNINRNYINICLVNIWRILPERLDAVISFKRLTE